VDISVIGCGYLGAVHAAAMASLGHRVVGVDVDVDRIRALSSGRAPFFEPGLDALLTDALATGLLTFTDDLAEVRGARVHFIAVGTPQSESGAADLRHIDAALASLVPHLNEGDLVVGKSTVPVGTADRLDVLVRERGARVAWNPEFLREGHAIHDTLSPDRIVYGVGEGDAEAVGMLDAVYAAALAQGVPRMVTDLRTAELVKGAANAFLAMKISFINAMAEIAETVDADVVALADAIGQDERIGRRFLNAGVGFGGGCLPKDIRGFIARSEELGVGEATGFLREVDAINLRRRRRIVEILAEELGELAGARVAVLGLAFKPESDDVRDSPALDVIHRLVEAGCEVVAVDPRAADAARRQHPDLKVAYADTAREAMHDADAVVLLTEWDQFRELDPAAEITGVRSALIVDGRNVLPADRWRAAGWRFRALGHGAQAKVVRP
jgi:UDPglucose 6-dehydrogenase